MSGETFDVGIDTGAPVGPYPPGFPCSGEIIGVTLDTSYTDGGSRISEVNPGGPAEAAGLRSGDIITALAGRETTDSTELVVAIRDFAPGDTVSITYLRSGESQTVDLVLGGSEDIG